eukprot:jgi/Bigna1/141961/aug1.66_g16669
MLHSTALAILCYGLFLQIHERVPGSVLRGVVPPHPQGSGNALSSGKERAVGAHAISGAALDESLTTMGSNFAADLDLILEKSDRFFLFNSGARVTRLMKRGGVDDKHQPRAKRSFDDLLDSRYKQLLQMITGLPQHLHSDRELFNDKAFWDRMGRLGVPHMPVFRINHTDPLYTRHFQEKVVKPSIPVVIQGLIDNDPGWEGARQKWSSPERMAEFYGSKASGSPLHKDPIGSGAWNALLYGQKRWCLFPPGTNTSLIGLKDGDPTTPPAYWWQDVYPRIVNDSRIENVELMQKPGEIVFVPAGWYHVVLNLDMSIAVTQNFVLPSMLESTSRVLASENPVLSRVFLAQLYKKRPSLVKRLYSDLKAGCNNRLISSKST